MSLEKAIWWLSKHAHDPAVGYITDADMAEAFRELYDSVFVDMRPELDALAQIKGEVGPEGPKGDQGDTGPEGPPGPQGATGATGYITAHVADDNDFLSGTVQQGQVGNLFITGALGLPFAQANISTNSMDVPTAWVDTGTNVMGPSGLLTVTHTTGPTEDAVYDPVARSLEITFPEAGRVFKTDIVTQATNTITHNLNTDDVSVTLIQNGHIVNADVHIVNVNTIEIAFQTTGQPCRVIVRSA